MGSFSIWHWFILIFWLLLAGVPMWRISNKAGFPGALSLLMFIPLLNLVLLWVFAFVKWPVENKSVM
jgi:hypothetical protein